MTQVRHVHIFITGRVQGVYFRNSMQQEALDFRVAGWVRNLPDGRVEAVLEGTEYAVEHLLEWCRHGPPAASVRHVEVLPGEPEGLEGFRVAR